ncbi:MAG: hypothetical protein ACT4N9_03740 [Paracoccaceae bacterium]
MNIARLFMGIGSLYIIVGVSIGAYMGGASDYTLVPVHAHMNLLGFVLMMVFGFFYHLYPAAAASRLAVAHFWLHQIGTAVLLSMLWLLLTGKIAEAAMFPLAPIVEVMVLLGLVFFAVNVWRHAK